MNLNKALIANALLYLLLPAGTGIITGRKMKKIRKIMKVNNAHSQELEKLITHNSLWFSIKMRTAIFLGVIFLMTVKPELEGSIITIAISIILGALPLRMRYTPFIAEVNEVIQKSDKFSKM